MSPLHINKIFELFKKYGSTEVNNNSSHHIRQIILAMSAPLTRTDTGWKYLESYLRAQTARETDADPFKTIHISPGQINYVSGGLKFVPRQDPPHVKHFEYPFKGLHTFGTVKNGDWDTRQDLFIEHPRYKAIEQWYIDDIPWENTDFFQNYLKIIERDDRSHKLKSKEQLLNKCNRYGDLLQKIKKHGYKSQRELGNPKPHREVSVSIGRNGEFLFSYGGSHRLSIAKVLDLEEIPVIVRVRHKEWQKLRNDIRTNNCVLSEEKSIYNHPDLQDLIN